MSFIHPDFADVERAIPAVNVVLRCSPTAEQIDQLTALFCMLGDFAYDHGQTEYKLTLGHNTRYFREPETLVFVEKGRAILGFSDALLFLADGVERPLVAP